MRNLSHYFLITALIAALGAGTAPTAVFATSPVKVPQVSVQASAQSPGSAPKPASDAAFAQVPAPAPASDAVEEEEEDEGLQPDKIVAQFQKFQEALEKLKTPNLVELCGPKGVPANPKRAQTCLDQYKLLLSKPSLKIDYFIGYMDEEDGALAYDTVEKASVAEWLQLPCTGKRQACGFKRSPKDANVFYKTVSWVGGTKIKVEINLHDSSLSTNNRENKKNPAQEAKSKLVEARFEQALVKSDLVIYDGHSRAGGGPDFRPPRYLKNGHVAYGWYKKNTPGLNRLQAGLKQRKDPLFALALNSCDSSLHFENPIGALQKVNKSLLTTRAIWDEGRQSSVGVLESVLGLRCDPNLGVPKESFVAVNMPPPPPTEDGLGFLGPILRAILPGAQQKPATPPPATSAAPAAPAAPVAPKPAQPPKAAATKPAVEPGANPFPAPIAPAPAPSAPAAPPVAPAPAPAAAPTPPGLSPGQKKKALELRARLQTAQERLELQREELRKTEEEYSKSHDSRFLPYIQTMYKNVATYERWIKFTREELTKLNAL